MTVQWISTTPESAWQEKAVSAAGGAPVHLKPSGRRCQTVHGFGGCFNEIGAAALNALDADAKRDVLAGLFDPQEGCRFGLCRLPIGASDYALEWYSHNEHDGDYAMEHFSIERDRRYLIPYIREALELRPDVRLFASPWSPPTWMKRPRAYNYGRLVWEEENLRAYALYFVRFVQAYAEEGITIHQVHPQNEPVADQKFPSCVWTGGQMRDFIRDYLAPAFREHGLGCEIWLGTINSDDYDAWANTVLSDPDARACIAGVGYQWAGKGAIQRTHESWPELALMQTENECGDGANTWDYAHYVFDLIRHYFSNGANAYVYWNMVLPSGGVSTWGWRQNSMITIDPDTGEATLEPEFHVMRHFSHFVEPGAVRLELTGPCAGNALAFENPDGSSVCVLANPFDHPRRVNIELGTQAFSADLPRRSFNTFAADGCGDQRAD